MSEIKVWVEPIDDVSVSKCPCCQRDMREGEGVLHSEGGELAYFGYQWTDGHEARFTLGICLLDTAGEVIPGMAVVSAQVSEGSIIYIVVEPEASPWRASEELGSIYSRQQILKENAIPDLFAYVDAISANDNRLSSRILSESASNA